MDVETRQARTGVVNVLPEMTFDAAALLAAKVSGQPVEFFLGLPYAEARGVRNAVRAFTQGLI